MIKKATECKDKHGRTLKVGDAVFVQAKIIDLPMDLEEGGKAIVKVQWLGAVPLSNLVESSELEKSEVGSQRPKKKPSKRNQKDEPAPEWR